MHWPSEIGCMEVVEAAVSHHVEDARILPLVVQRSAQEWCVELPGCRSVRPEAGVVCEDAFAVARSTARPVFITDKLEHNGQVRADVCENTRTHNRENNAHPNSDPFVSGIRAPRSRHRPRTASRERDCRERRAATRCRYTPSRGFPVIRNPSRRHRVSLGRGHAVSADGAVAGHDQERA
jgi:hypothetical protein